MTRIKAQKCPLDIIYDNLSKEYKASISSTLNIGTQNHNALSKPHLTSWSGSLTRHLKARIASRFRIECQYTASYNSVNTGPKEGYPISTEFGVAYIGPLEFNLYMLCESNRKLFYSVENDEHSMKKYLIDTVFLPVLKTNILPQKMPNFSLDMAMDIDITDVPQCALEFTNRANAAARGEFICKPVEFSKKRYIDSKVLSCAKVIKIVGMSSVGRLHEDLSDPSLKPMFLVEVKAPQVFLDREANILVLATDGKTHYLARRMLTEYVCVENRNYVDLSTYYDGGAIESAISNYTSDMAI